MCKALTCMFILFSFWSSYGVCGVQFSGMFYFVLRAVTRQSASFLFSFFVGVYLSALNFALLWIPWLFTY